MTRMKVASTSEKLLMSRHRRPTIILNVKERFKKINIKEFRGEGTVWNISRLENVLNCFEEVIKDAKDENLSKKGASRNDIHIYE